jgi:uncharacterized membrane protein YgcG
VFVSQKNDQILIVFVIFILYIYIFIYFVLAVIVIVFFVLDFTTFTVQSVGLAYFIDRILHSPPFTPQRHIFTIVTLWQRNKQEHRGPGSRGGVNRKSSSIFLSSNGAFVRTK